MSINSTLLKRSLGILLVALALNMAAAAFDGGSAAEASDGVYTPRETATFTLPPPPTATSTQPPPTNPPPTNPPPSATNTPTATPTRTVTPTKIIVLPKTGTPDSGAGTSLAMIAGALATAGAGLFLASRRPRP